MKFESPLISGTIKKRYKRFLADITLDSGEEVTAHTANTGSMRTCWEPGWKVLLSRSNNPKRKLAYSLEMTNNGKTWIGINTSRPNFLAEEAIKEGRIPELAGHKELKREVKIGKSRIDILLQNSPHDQCFVEVKNVTLCENESEGYFPDAVSTRGQKHLEELIQLRQRGIGAAMLYIVQREDVKSFSPAHHIDPNYARLLRQAAKEGVTILAYQCRLTPEEVSVNNPLPLVF